MLEMMGLMLTVIDWPFAVFSIVEDGTTIVSGIEQTSLVSQISVGQLLPMTKVLGPNFISGYGE
jgi:hypothetical protein